MERGGGGEGHAGTGTGSEVTHDCTLFREGV